MRKNGIKIFYSIEPVEQALYTDEEFNYGET